MSVAARLQKQSFPAEVASPWKATHKEYPAMRI